MNVIIIGKGNLANAFKEYASKNKEFKVLDYIDEKSIIQDYKNVDAVIDFSYKDAIVTSLSLALKYQVPLIIGTTNYSSFQLEVIKSHSKKIPICLEANYSIGFNVLKRLNEYIKELNIPKDMYVIEAHQKYKKDKPSGSSKVLNINEENIFSLRGSSINGEHEIRVFFENEELSLKHTIHSRLAFVDGVIKVSEYLKNKSNGLYSYDDLWEEIYR